MLKIKRSVERFGRDMIEMVKQEQEYSKIVDEESKIKNNSIVQSTNDFLT
jgi:hypothetical protein